MFIKSLSALAVAAVLGLSMGAAQARDFDHHGHGYRHVDHRNASHHRHHVRHHHVNRHHHHDGRR